MTYCHVRDRAGITVEPGVRETREAETHVGALPSCEIVLFTPADISKPAGSTQILQELAQFTEAFFGNWLERCGYSPKRTKIFSRDENGTILVRSISGEFVASSGVYDNWENLADKQIQRKICKKTVRQYRIPRNGNYFWIFMYLGKGKRYKDWKGTGGPRRGGHCVVRYPNGGDFCRPKTYIHEFGHALGLPHVGPVGDDRFCNLMGPTDKAYRDAKGHDYDAFGLTAAEAAMLWKHPVFSGTVTSRKQFPGRIAFSQFKTEYDRIADSIMVTVMLYSDIECHSLVVIDQPAGVSDYWRKGYAGRRTTDGLFHIRIPKPRKEKGSLMFLPCFTNGVNTGDGKEHGLRTAIRKDYCWTNGSYRFEDL